ncbi:acyltransferase [Schinkia azotoformans]|uniref:acyltransferase n=1 Tax=Schinkia azotoformans TaxID=1454 RepID=UPI002DB76E6B|nr:acyltransferase [Schinkia azotoformans]MEC1714851.1 acyltransferase [Schinkia azotoformans]
MRNHRWTKIKCFLIPTGAKRTKFLLKNKIFKEVGENFFFFPRKIPQDPELIIFHNNVTVATDVMFINHDIMHFVFNNMTNNPKEICKKNYECIEIMDNVFIGAKSVILPGVRLGPNVIVAAGSVVTKDFQGGVIIGGNPAKVIGNFEEIRKKRIEDTQNNHFIEDKNDRAYKEWLKFYKKKDK